MRKNAMAGEGEEGEEEEGEEATDGEETDGEDPSRQKLRIRRLPPNMDTVNSMCRLYAVPSEKIRVWSVWLTQVGDEAESWHRWLHAYIDLLLRMAKRLKELEDAEEEKIRMKPETGEKVRRVFAYEEDTITEDGIEYPPGVKDFYDIEGVLASIVSGEKKPNGEKSAAEEDETEDGDKLPHGLEDFANEGTPPKKPEDGEEEAEGEGEEEGRMAGGADEEPEPEPEDATAGAEEAGYDTEGEGEDWGEGEMEEEEDESQDYLKEWPIGRQWEPSGIREEIPWPPIEPMSLPNNPEELRQLIYDFTREATMYRSYYKHWLETADQAVKEIVGRQVLPTAKINGILDENDLEASLKACLGYPPDAFRKSDICFAPPGKIAAMMAMAERVGTVEFIKDMARADENIPYFFYRKALPDTGIAIQHNDEEIILPDPGMEVISCNSEHLRFNLTDKPGHGGKCSVGMDG